VLKSAPHSPKMNSICERVIGTIRRECLDWLIPLPESQLRSIPKSWVAHYNGGRPDMSLGPGIPELPCSPRAHITTTSHSPCQRGPRRLMRVSAETICAATNASEAASILR
jgi:putative transposase